MSNKDIALAKIGWTDISQVSCHKCGKHNQREVQEREGSHSYLDASTGKQCVAYKLEFLCPVSKEVIAGAVVWEHEKVN